MDAGHQIDKRRTPLEVAKTKRFNVKIRKKGYSILVEGSHSEHWYGETGSESPVNPTAQAYVVGWVQLSNLQKLAEGQSCYSSPKENLIKDRWKRRKWPTKKSEGKLHWTKPWERRNELGGATKIKRQQKKTMRGYTLSLKRHQQYDWRDQTSTDQRWQEKKTLAL